MEGKALDLLVERASHGDDHAFEELAAAHLPGLYRAALALVGPSDARDLTQEVLVTAWRELPRLRKPESFAPWLRRILLNRCRNHYRASARRERATLRLTEEWRCGRSLGRWLAENKMRAHLPLYREQLPFPLDLASSPAYCQ